MSARIKFELKGLDAMMAKLKDNKLIVDGSDIDKIVRKNARPYATALKSEYSRSHATKPNRYKKKNNLADSIELFERKRKGSSDPYYTYYVGPRYTNKNSVFVGGGNAAHLLEFGTVNRFRANTKKGGVGKKSGVRTVYGAKLSTGRIQPLGIIRKISDEQGPTTLNTMGKEIIESIKKTAKQNGFK